MAFFLFVRTIRAYYVDILTKKCYSENRKPTRRRSVMAKTSTNISLDPELKRSSQELFADLGIDLSTAITLFLKQSLRVQGLPFVVTRENPNAETAAALNEYAEMKAHPEKYKRYASFKDAMNEVLTDA
jgi:addiction module antitoxin, relB/dinJ family